MRSLSSIRCPLKALGRCRNYRVMIVTSLGGFMTRKAGSPPPATRHQTPSGVCAPPGALSFALSRANVGGPEAARRGLAQPHFDRTLPEGLLGGFWQPRNAESRLVSGFPK